MFLKYRVYYNNEYVETVVALTPKSAIDKVYNKSIGCSLYSGKAYNNYHAERVPYLFA